jgi:hypothetical protein
MTTTFALAFAPVAAVGKRPHETESDGGAAGTYSHDMPSPKRVRGGGTPIVKDGSVATASLYMREIMRANTVQ